MSKRQAETYPKTQASVSGSLPKKKKASEEVV